MAPETATAQTSPARSASLTNIPPRFDERIDRQADRGLCASGYQWNPGAGIGPLSYSDDTGTSASFTPGYPRPLRESAGLTGFASLNQGRVRSPVTQHPSSGMELSFLRARQSCIASNGIGSARLVAPDLRYVASMVEETGAALRFDQANVLQRGMRLLAGTRPMAWLFARVLHHLDGPVMRRSAGRHSVSSALTGLPIVELTTVGARSGEPRSSPLVGVPDGDRLVLVASNYGQQRNPAWYYNLKVNPRCSVTFRGQRREMDAYEAEGEERQRLWRLDVAVYPPRNQYARRAGDRRIPVMVLRPVENVGLR
jgi:deazaflavin-dependent oxidoreductase (nitroreductase family)